MKTSIKDKRKIEKAVKGTFSQGVGEINCSLSP